MAGLITSPADLIARLKRRLGEPYFKCQITLEQFQDLIFDAFNLYTQYGYDGTQRGVYVLDTVDGQTSYTLPSTIYAVTGIMSRSTFSTFYLRFPTNQATLQEVSFIFGLLGGGTIDGAQSTMLLNLMNVEQFNTLFVPKEDFNYNWATNTLHLMQTPGLFAPSNKLALLIESYIDRDGTGATQMFNNPWILSYTECLAKIQMYYNLSKFAGATLPGGASINTEIYNAKEEKKALEDQLVNKLGDMSALYGINFG